MKLHSNRVKDEQTGEIKSVRKKFNGVLVTSLNYKQLLEEGGRNLINFHNKHLRAYLRDEQWFRHGVDEEGQPKMHPVLKQYVIEPA